MSSESSELVLYVYDYNYSSWSMRAGLAIRQTGAIFREVCVQENPEHVPALKALSPNGLFPVLKHAEELIWDSLAIAEYLAERFPNAGLWPSSSLARAHARSLCAEMHSGFATLRSALPMNIRAQYPGFLKSAPVRAQIERITSMWQGCLERYGASDGPFLFGAFSLADAFFAPVVMRFTCYDVKLAPQLSAYASAVREHSYVKDWIARAQLDRYVNPAYEYVR